MIHLGRRLVGWFRIALYLEVSPRQALYLRHAEPPLPFARLAGRVWSTETALDEWLDASPTLPTRPRKPRTPRTVPQNAAGSRR